MGSILSTNGPSDNPGTIQMRLNEYEQIAFTYEKIEWTWLEGGISAADSWMQRT